MTLIRSSSMTGCSSSGGRMSSGSWASAGGMVSSGGSSSNGGMVSSGGSSSVGGTISSSLSVSSGSWTSSAGAGSGGMKSFSAASAGRDALTASKIANVNEKSLFIFMVFSPLYSRTMKYAGMGTPQSRFACQLPFQGSLFPCSFGKPPLKGEGDRLRWRGPPCPR